MYFWTYGLRKIWLDKCLKSLVSEDTSERRHLYHIYWSLWRQFSLKRSFIVICKISELFLNILTADDKYSLPNGDNLISSDAICEKRKTFSEFIFEFWKFKFDFEHFRKKDDGHSLCIFEITDSKKRGYINV